MTNTKHALATRRVKFASLVLSITFALTVAISKAEINAQTRLPKPDHIVVVLEENKDYSTIIGSVDAPYLNTLATQGALFTDSHGISHPSQPNYLDLFSGSDFGIKNDNPPSAFLPGTSLCGMLTNANLTFRGYAESLPDVGAMNVKAGRYARKHCPWTDFADVPATDNVPFDGYFPDTAEGFSKMPTVSFVVPNLDNDMHDGSVAEGDKWMRNRLNSYVEWAKTHNSLLIITFDEDEGTRSNKIPTIFVGPMVRAGQYGDRIDHFNVLRTIEDMYSLPAAGKSAGSSDISNVWNGSA